MGFPVFMKMASTVLVVFPMSKQDPVLITFSRSALY